MKKHKISALYHKSVGRTALIAVLSLLLYAAHFLIFFLPVNYTAAAVFSLALQALLWFVNMEIFYIVCTELDSSRKKESVALLVLDFILLAAILVSFFYQIIFLVIV